MSKRLSVGQSNTLFNYFQSPKGAGKTKDANTNGKSNLNEPVKVPDTEEDIEDGPRPATKKRNHTALVDSDSDDENSSASHHKEPFNAKKPKLNSTENESNSENEDDTEKPVRKGRNKNGKNKRRRIITTDSESDCDDQQESPKTSDCSQDSDKETTAVDIKRLTAYYFEKSTSDSNKENIEKKIFARSERNIPELKADDDDDESLDDGIWLHTTLDFLNPDKIRDINKNPKEHPDYDERTLYVPEDFLNKQTPGMRQWWTLKSKHYDSILFFKVGKFYEMYHMDAVTVVNVLGFAYMKGEFAHSGFPEVAYGRMAGSLAEKGFKVARVEQTETPDMLAERLKTAKIVSKHDKVVSREICQITTNATCVYGAQLTDASLVAPSYMLTIAEKVTTNGSRFGVCLIDTSIGLFHVGEFDDDKYYSRLLALLAEYAIGLVITERGCLQSSTNDLLKTTHADIRRDTLAPNVQFYSAQNTVDLLTKACYFRNKNDDFEWPPVLKDFIENGSAKPEYELAIRALGACMWYLKDSELDIPVLSMQKFEVYQPMDMVVNKDLAKRDSMVLDSMCIEHLSLLGVDGSLQRTLDFCDTEFGRRLLRRWICRPLCMQHRILERQTAVRELFQNDELRQAAHDVLRELPDLERQVAKIHIFGNRFCATIHPDGRAIFYEAKTYSKRKIQDLLTTLSGFEKAQELAEIFKNCESSFLKKITQHPPNGTFLNLSETIRFFKEAFDQNQAEAEGKIIPQKGVDEDYDQAVQAIVDLQEEIDAYLVEQEKFFGSKLSYFGNDKKRYQIEVPENKAKKANKDYKAEGSRKGSKPVKRFTTSTTRQFLVDMMKAEKRKANIIQDLNRRIFEKFSNRQEEWEQCIQCLMMLDVVCSFAEYARTLSGDVCFPNILPFQDEPYLNIENGVHPCTLVEDFVPNSTQLGTKNAARIMILTGPNMGGKSTLMRQVALLVVMAQMGCPIPAVGCELSLVDRIFTRLGANDDIVRGQSTFVVELTEASTVLQHATRNSLVFLDELGRGTSTFDGSAIATAYLHKLATFQCRTIFSTHYHNLVTHFCTRNDIQLAHMSCMTENDDDYKEDDDPVQPVTLLYQLKEGNCPKSFGFNAAKLAGLPKSLIHRAHEAAKELSEIRQLRRIIYDLAIDDIADARSAIECFRKGI